MKRLDNFDMDLDLGELSFDESEDSIQIEKAKQSLYEDLGLTDIDFDSSDDGDLSITDDTDFFLDLEGEEESDLGSAAEILRSYADISTDLIPYWQYANNALQKLFAESNMDIVARSMPAITEFNYIADVTKRQQVYGFFCQMLDDLTTDSQYLGLSEEEAFNLLVDELYNELHWTPNINIAKLKATFVAYYEDNKKLSSAKHVDKNSISVLLDRQNLELSELVFRINSVPFNLVTKFFGDPSLINTSLKMDTSMLGGLADEIKKRQGVRNLTHRDAYSGIVSFLTSEETITLLGLSMEDVTVYSVGELFRRYVLYELNDGAFYPQGIMKLSSGGFSDGLITQLVKSLYSSVQKQSFAAELIFITIDLMMHAGEGVMDARQQRYTYKEYFQAFCVGISQYLSSFANDKALCNPVFYTLIDSVDEGERSSASQFNLTYTEGDDVHTVTVPGILCEVVGDNSNIYHIPLVYLGPKSHSVLCPPKEVVDGVRRVTASGRMSISGPIHYRYVPSYNWLSTLNITATGRKARIDSADTTTAHVSNPLLAMLLSYTNQFDMSGDVAEVVSIHSSDVTQLLGVRRTKDESIEVSRMLLQGVDKPVTSGVLAIDKDTGGIVVSYTDPVTSENSVLLLDEGDYEEDKITEEVVGRRCDFVTTFLGRLSSSNEGKPFLRATVKRLCKLTSLDYEMLLSDVREFIARNLDFIIQSSCIDQLLGYQIFEMYLDAIKSSDGKLSDFNFTTLKEVALFVLGEDNPFAAHDHFGDKDVEALIRLTTASKAEMDSVLKKFDAVDMHLLALQVLSRGEVGSSGEMNMYQSMHCVPVIHCKLRELEDKMVLLRVLSEVGDDVVTILMKRSALNNFYSGVSTRDNIASLEKSITSALKQSTPVDLRATKAVLNSLSIECLSLLKYFILGRDAYGVLSTLSELSHSGEDMTDLKEFRVLGQNLIELLGLNAEEDFSVMSEEDFYQAIPRRDVDRAFNACYANALLCVYQGLASEVGRMTDLRVVKAYDLFDRFGALLFNFTESDAENFEDFSEFTVGFMSYVGSFLLSFCPVDGEATDAIDGGVDRVTAYIQHRLDYFPSATLAELESYDLVDLHLVEGADGSDALEG